MSVLSAMRLRYETLRSLPFSSISGTYAGVGTPFLNPARVVKIFNLTDANLLISLNGIDDVDIVPSQTGQILDIGSNKSDQAGNFEEPAGDRIYVKQESTPATSGSVYVTVIYASAV